MMESEIRFALLYLLVSGNGRKRGNEETPWEKKEGAACCPGLIGRLLVEKNTMKASFVNLGA